MSPDFVRYSPEIETIDPNIEELTAQIIEFWEKTVRESPTREGTGHAVRGAHGEDWGRHVRGPLRERRAGDDRHEVDTARLHPDRRAAAERGAPLPPAHLVAIGRDAAVEALHRPRRQVDVAQRVEE